jgi:hypothetical protein
MNYARFFERSERANGENFLKLKEDSPDSLVELVRDMHTQIFDSMPCDWVFMITKEAFEELEENSLDELNIEADCYAKDLYKWLGKSYSDNFIQEAIDDGLVDLSSGIWNLVGVGQSLAKQKIYEAVSEYLEEQKHMQPEEEAMME